MSNFSSWIRKLAKDFFDCLEQNIEVFIFVTFIVTGAILLLTIFALIASVV